MDITKAIADPDVLGFARQVGSLRESVKELPFLFQKAPADPDAPLGELLVLRRWNSHTPAIENVEGGGYFLRWGGRGTVIDPGCGFVRIFKGQDRFGLCQIDMVIATHDHIDHCHDFGTLITLHREANKWGVRGQRPGFPRCLDIVASHGVMAQFAAILNHPENAPFLRCKKVLPPSPVVRVQEPPSAVVAQDGSLVDLTRSPAEHLQGLVESYHKTIEEQSQYAFELHALPAKHRELLGQHTSMGVRFNLQHEEFPCSVVISGDTSVEPHSLADDTLRRKFLSASVLARCYANADLLILHVGTLEEMDSSGRALKREKEHLGLIGVVEVLHELAELAKSGNDTALPKIVVLTEWGKEFDERDRRAQFAESVVRGLRRRGDNADEYFPATRGVTRTGDSIPIVPADLGLRIRLPDLHVWSKDADGFIAPADVRAYEQAGEINY